MSREDIIYKPFDIGNGDDTIAIHITISTKVSVLHGNNRPCIVNGIANGIGGC